MSMQEENRQAIEMLIEFLENVKASLAEAEDWLKQVENHTQVLEPDKSNDFVMRILTIVNMTKDDFSIIRGRNKVLRNTFEEWWRVQ